MNTSTYIAPKSVGKRDEYGKKQGRWQTINSLTSQLETEIDYKDNVPSGLVKRYNSLSFGELMDCIFIIEMGMAWENIRVEGERIKFTY